MVHNIVLVVDEGAGVEGKCGKSGDNFDETSSGGNFNSGGASGGAGSGDGEGDRSEEEEGGGGKEEYKAEGSRPVKDKNIQTASAKMMENAIKEYTRGLRVQQAVKDFLKEKAHDFLGKLLNRPELSGSLKQEDVKNAINQWIPVEGDIGLGFR